MEGLVGLSKCEWITYSRLLRVEKVAAPRFESATYRSRNRHVNHSTTVPHKQTKYEEFSCSAVYGWIEIGLARVTERYHGMEKGGHKTGEWWRTRTRCRNSLECTDKDVRSYRWKYRIVKTRLGVYTRKEQELERILDINWLSFTALIVGNGIWVPWAL